ncbi:MAG: spore cortex biosynthesis protein YabQ [Clostridium sp.]
MIFDMGRQITLFIFSLFSGMLVGIFFDVYRVIRGFEEPGTVITAIQDLLFWILTGIIVFIFMMYTNYAYMSFNVFVYNGIGLFVYFKLFSHIFLLGYGKILNAILTIFRVMFYYLFYPIRIIFHKIIKKI